jgi:hypothetical protein
LGINKKAKDNKNEETELELPVLHQYLQNYKIITSVLIEGNKFQKF